MALNSSPVIGRILSGLTRYRYLTVGQYLHRFGGDEKTARERFRDLERGRFIKRHKWSEGAEVGRLSDVWWLTELGARMATDVLGEAVKAPNQKPAIGHLKHRILTVSALVAADVWALARIGILPEITSYMEGFAVEFGGYTVAPDAVITLFNEAGEKRRIYAIEAHCSHYGGGRHMHPVNKLEIYAKEAPFVAFDQAFGVVDETAPRVGILSVCDTAALRDRLLRTVPARPEVPTIDQLAWSRFLFKAGSEVADFGAGWWSIKGNGLQLPY